MILEHLFTKTLNIAFTNFQYLSFGLLSSIIIEKIYGHFHEEEYDKKNIISIFLEIFIQSIIISFSVYLIIKAIQNMPSFIYQNTKIGEAYTNIILSFSIFLFQENYRKKIQYVIKKRLVV